MPDWIKGLVVVVLLVIALKNQELVVGLLQGAINFLNS